MTAVPLLPSTDAGPADVDGGGTYAGRMADTWGTDGPPPEAYSRVTRDLALLTAAFAAYLDELPDELTPRYDCSVRDLSERETGRLRKPGLNLDAGYAVEPSGPDSATLLVGRSSFEGGASAVLGFGIAALALVPDCFCDACDEDGASLIAQAQEFVESAVLGCVEFRRPYSRRAPERLFDGPWMEEGFATRELERSHAGAGIRGEAFSRQWQPWTRRSAVEAR